MLFALTCSEEIHPFKVLNYILYFISHEKVCTQAEAQASSSYAYTCGCDIPHPPPPTPRPAGELCPIREGSARKWYLFQASDI